MGVIDLGKAKKILDPLAGFLSVTANLLRESSPTTVGGRGDDTMTLRQLPVIDVDGPQTVWIPPACRLEPHPNETWVYVGDAVFAIVRPGDAYQSKLVAAQLVRAGVITLRDAAQAFGYHVNSIRHWAQQLQRNGTLHERDFKPGPAGPSKMTPEIFRFV